MPPKKEKRTLTFHQSAILLHSKICLSDIELNRLAKAANLRKEMGELIQEWIEAVAQARFARWVGEYKELLEEHSGMVVSDEGANLEEVFRVEREAAL